jgi:regulator of sigma E protease
MVMGFADLVRGEVPLSALGGPIMIGYVAGVAAEQGLDQYLWLIAVLSINLALLNFLPIPILDGGQLMFFLTALALRNDVVRYLIR